MRIEVDIPDDKLKNVSHSAKLRVRNVSKVYIEEVLDEASRIEEARRTNNSTAEITAAIIDDAVHFAKNYGVRKKKSKKRIFAQIVAFICSALTGGFFEIDKLNTLNYLLPFLFFLLSSTVATLSLIYNDNSNE